MQVAWSTEVQPSKSRVDVSGTVVLLMDSGAFLRQKVSVSETEVVEVDSCST
jgi:hypothetical protein